MTRVLGPLVSSWSFEQAARMLLLPDRNVLGLYLDELARQTGENVRIERPRSVLVRETASRFAEDQLPGIILRCSGTVGEPTREGDGTYTADWAMSVIAVTQATGTGNGGPADGFSIARSTASDLCAAAAAVLIHYLPRVDSRVVSVRWDGEDSAELDLGDDQRSRSVVGRGLVITVQDILCDLAGLPDLDDAPLDPPIGEPAEDAGDLLTVDSVDATVTPVEVFA